VSIMPLLQSFGQSGERWIDSSVKTLVDSSAEESRLLVKFVTTVAAFE